MKFDITIPVLDEEATLRQNVQILYEFLTGQFPDVGQWQIIIADNGSTDRTADIARELEQELPGVKYLRVPRRGVGLALKTSWSQSKAEIVGYMDLDLATDLSHFPEAFYAIAERNHDLVYASRLHPNSKVINRPFKREVASRVFNFLLQTYLKVGFSDGMCGFKFLRRTAFERLYRAGAQNDGWFFSTELLVIAEWLEMKVFELPVKWTDDISSSRVKIIPLAKRYIKSMIELKRLKPEVDGK